MKKICKFLLGLSLLLTLILACSTLPTESDDLEASQGKGSVNFALSGVSSTNSNILFSTSNSEDTPSRVSISYRKSGATSEATTSMELSAFGSSFVLADPISLEAGNYEVTKFDVLSSSGKTIYSTPMTGSLVDSFLKVKTSLIYSFTIISGKASTIDMQVVEVNDDSDPADFGRDAFTYEVISYNEFYIKTSLINEKSELTPTTATLTIKNPSGDIITNANLSADKNKILVPNYDIYTIIVSKEGLLPKSYSFSKADLTKYKKEALEVHLFSTTHVYKLINKSLSWKAAKTYCENMGGYLVTITNVDEKEYILNKIMIPNNVSCCWGGASDFRNEGTWSWENKKENWIYSNWASGEPSNYGGNEDYLLINRDGTWNDYGDGHTIFICEWDSEAEVKEYSEHVYKLYEKSLSWSEAKAYCENLGGYLVSITSQEEQKYIFDNIIVPNNVPCCWAGGSDSETEGVWKWASGEEWIYNNWRAGEPNNYGGNEDYLLLYGTGVWNDYADGNTFFICEWNSEEDKINSDFHKAEWFLVDGELGIQRRSDWWDSLEEQWKKAFNNNVLYLGNITTKPSDGKIQAIFNKTGIDVNNVGLTNLSGIKCLTNLTFLNCGGNKLTSLKGLENCTNLTSLFCTHNQLSSLTGLENCTNLTTLGCNNNQLTSLTGIENCTNLTGLDCSSNQLKSLTGLENCTNLASLYCGHNQLSSLTGIENCTNLTYLSCYNNQLSSLTGIENCTKLTFLNCGGNKLTSLKGLENCTNLNYLSCFSNQLSSLTGIENCTNLTTLWCGGNQLSNLEDIKGLTNLTYLYCSNNQLSSLTGLENLTNLTTLDCSNNQLSNEEVARIKAILPNL